MKKLRSQCVHLAVTGSDTEIKVNGDLITVIVYTGDDRKTFYSCDYSELLSNVASVFANACYSLSSQFSIRKRSIRGGFSHSCKWEKSSINATDIADILLSDIAYIQ